MINFVNFSDESLARVFGTILDWRLNQGFANPVKQLSAAVVQATIDVYNTIASNLLPTPAKSHYTFNLRDLSKVFQGTLQGDPANIKEKDGFIRLWVRAYLLTHSPTHSLTHVLTHSLTYSLAHRFTSVYVCLVTV